MTLDVPILLTLLFAAASPWWVAWSRRSFLAAGVLLHTAHFGHYLVLLGSLARGGETPRSAAGSWFPTNLIEWSFAGTPWGLLFSLLITGIGLLVFLYAGGYFGDSPKGTRFFAPLLVFEAAMLGVVLSDHAVLMFLFWELTSVSSFFLIAFNHRESASRHNALQALLVTGLGGVAMLAGFLLLGDAWGGYSIEAWCARALAGGEPPVAALWLILLGAVTKSALFPFFFWLPNAMSAPTPVSGYLHSATMVKAGVFLIGALHPVLSRSAAVMETILILGALTTVAAVVLGWRKTDLKAILAHTTLAVLGLLALLLGIGSPEALKVATLFLLGHACYKAGLFMTAGAVDKAAGSRDVGELGGLRRRFPLLAGAAVVLALSGIGFPPLLGFLGKEYAYKLGLSETAGSLVLTAFLFAANTAIMTLTLRAAWSPFGGVEGGATAGRPLKPLGPLMLCGPVVLALAGVLLGLAAPAWLTPVVNAVVGRMHGADPEFSISLWYGFQPPLLLGALTLVCGALLYRATGPDGGVGPVSRILGLCEGAYGAVISGLMKGSSGFSAWLQNGDLNRYIRCFIVCLLLLVGWKWLGSGYEITMPRIGDDGVAWLELALAPVIAGFVLLAALTVSRILALLSLAVVGLSVVLVFARMGAPDLALTLLLVETFTVVLFVRVVRGLPKLRTISSTGRRWADAGIAAAVGLMMALLSVKAQSVQTDPSISAQLTEWSYALAKGGNVVNVILVDFRALDTLGEITVIALAAVGVFLLWTRAGRAGGNPKPEEDTP